MLAMTAEQGGDHRQHAGRGLLLEPRQRIQEPGRRRQAMAGESPHQALHPGRAPHPIRVAPGDPDRQRMVEIDDIMRGR